MVRAYESGLPHYKENDLGYFLRRLSPRKIFAPVLDRITALNEVCKPRALSPRKTFRSLLYKHADAYRNVCPGSGREFHKN